MVPHLSQTKVGNAKNFDYKNRTKSCKPTKNWFWYSLCSQILNSSPKCCLPNMHKYSFSFSKLPCKTKITSFGKFFLKILLVLIRQNYTFDPQLFLFGFLNLGFLIKGHFVCLWIWLLRESLNQKNQFILIDA